jgi:peptidase YpeB-like protein
MTAEPFTLSSEPPPAKRQWVTREPSFPVCTRTCQNQTCIMKPKDFLLSVILIVALSAFISSGVASDKNEAKHSGKITKARAERIALTKVPSGSIRSAELETTRGQRFWSVYIAKPGSKNAKEIRVDATSGQILAVQTERPEDQAEEPTKNH